jgi:hypothetical protein
MKRVKPQLRPIIKSNKNESYEALNSTSPQEKQQILEEEYSHYH